MDMLEMKKALFDSGVVGAGGAGFPTHAKLSDKADTILLNCAECEPLIKVDRQLITEYVREILSGMKMVVDTLGAEQGIIAVKKSYTTAIEAVNNIIGEFDKIKLHILPDIYPAGDEAVLVYEATGRVVPQGKIPLMVNCIVFNVETILNLYRKITEDKNVTRKYVTVAGEVKRPVTVEVPVGMTVRELVDMAGGLKREDAVVLLGGPMTGKIGNMSDIVTKTTKAILLLPPECPPIRKRQTVVSRDIRKAMSVCSQCQMCTDLCPRNLIGQSIKPHEFMRAIANGLTDNVDPLLNSMFCCSCGLCEMYSCHQGLSPRKLLDEYKAGLKSKGVRVPDKPSGPVKAMREVRKVPEHRLVYRLGLHSYDLAAPMMKYDGPVKEVKLLLRQCIGAPVKPVVSVGDTVVEGQLIGEVPEGALGTCLHASIDGQVTAVNDNYIMIKS
jgi:Na+-translocating ferredoxin:NAD+ oxidoreductase RnfC subunit